MISIRFICGHTVDMADKAAARPICLWCGETRIDAVTAPTPRFRGTATGPHVTPEALEPIAVNLGTRRDKPGA